jgi:adenine-specific DNA methylase
VAYRFLLITVVLLGFVNPALANWWVVRAADGKCLVVDVEPSGNDVAKVGKDVYQTQEQAEAAVKSLCKEDQLPRAPENAE